MKRGLIASCSKKRKHFVLFYYVKSLQYDAWDKIIKLSSQFYREDNLRKIFTLLVLTKANMIHSYDSWFFLNKLWAIGPNLLRQLCLCCTGFCLKKAMLNMRTGVLTLCSHHRWKSWQGLLLKRYFTLDFEKGKYFWWLKFKVLSFKSHS